MKKIIQWVERIGEKGPDIVLDFEIQNNSVFIRLYNNSQLELFDVQVEFNETILGLGGERVISELNVFKNLKYMAPNKELLIYVDEIDSFYANLKNEIVTAFISFSRRKGRRSHKTIVHNLSIYKDLVLIKKNK